MIINFGLPKKFNFKTIFLMTHHSMYTEYYLLKHFVKREAEAYLELGYEKSKYLLHSNYIFTHDNGIIYVMEYCQGGTLYEYLRDNSLIISDDETRKIMKKLLKGLNHLH